MTRTLFSGGLVYDGTTAMPSEADVVVKDGRIVEVGTDLDGDESVDCSGGYLSPGFFDCHVHVTMDAPSQMQLIETPFSLQFYSAAANLKKTLDIGITSVRDAGGADQGIKEAVLRGLIPGPRMQLSIIMLSQTGALRNGVRSIEHGIFLDDEAIEMMLQRGAWLVPTLHAPRAVIAAADAGLPLAQSVVDKARDVAAAHVDSVTRAHQAGVRIAMGTDCGVGPHGTNLEELELMTEAGLTPLDALRATTGSAAELLDVATDRGTIRPGQRADLVLVDGDPQDVTKLGDRVRAVYLDGREVSRRPA